MDSERTAGKHTKGPWCWKGPSLLSPRGEVLSCGDVGVGDPGAGDLPVEPDACLIAAAPDLLEALQQSRGQWIHSVNAEACLAAIAKATGEGGRRDEQTDDIT